MVNEFYERYKRIECGDDGPITTSQDILNDSTELWIAAHGLISRQDFWDTVNQAGIGLPGEYDTLKEYFDSAPNVVTTP